MAAPNSTELSTLQALVYDTLPSWRKVPESDARSLGAAYTLVAIDLYLLDSQLRALRKKHAFFAHYGLREYIIIGACS